MSLAFLWWENCYEAKRTSTTVLSSSSPSVSYSHFISNVPSVWLLSVSWLFRSERIGWLTHPVTFPVPRESDKMFMCHITLWCRLKFPSDYLNFHFLLFPPVTSFTVLSHALCKSELRFKALCFITRPATFHRIHRKCLSGCMSALKEDSSSCFVCVSFTGLFSHCSFLSSYFRVIEQLGGKQLVMNHMHHEDQLVRYNALLAVQKLMVHNWYAHIRTSLYVPCGFMWITRINTNEEKCGKILVYNLQHFQKALIYSSTFQTLNINQGGSSDDGNISWGIIR